MSNESMRRDAWKIIRKTLKEAMPDQAVEKALRARSFTKPVTLFSIGKAAWQMASAAERSLGNQIKQGIVLTKYGHSKGEIPRCEILEAGHPVPDANSVFGAQKMAGLARSLTQNDQVLFLISGGGSALFELPLVPLEELQDITRQLLACGAEITEINLIRKRLSGVKEEGLPSFALRLRCFPLSCPMFLAIAWKALRLVRRRRILQPRSRPWKW